MKKQKKSSLNRRQFLKQSTATTAALSGMGSLSLMPKLLANQAEPHRFLTVFLQGGWDSHLATDPVIGSKASSGNFDATYNGLDTYSISGKPNLIIGEGLEPARSAFSSINTAFMNGLFVEVTAHELAVRYLLSGTLSLTRSREYPALAALLGANATTFPAHLVLGSKIPLADTVNSTPPLHGQSGEGISEMLIGPYSHSQWYDDQSFARAHKLIKDLDANRGLSLPAAHGESLAGWRQSTTAVEELYAKGIGSQMVLTDEILGNYSAPTAWSFEALFATAFLAMKNDLSRYITLTIPGFDTHSSHLSKHRTNMQKAATGLNRLISDLRATQDPQAPTKTLAETTTILVTSEFVRTPKFNDAAGTDHWDSGSAILMGKGVTDNVVIGSTGDDAKAMGWNGTSAETRTTENALLPDHLVATLLDHFGLTAEAEKISTGRIHGLLT